MTRVVYDEMICWLMEWDRSHWASLACAGTVGDLHTLLPPLHHSQHDTKPIVNRKITYIVIYVH